MPLRKASRAKSLCSDVMYTIPNSSQARVNFGSNSTARLNAVMAAERSPSPRALRPSASDWLAPEDPLGGSCTILPRNERNFAVLDAFGTTGALEDDVCTYWLISFCMFLRKLL